MEPKYTSWEGVPLSFCMNPVGLAVISYLSFTYSINEVPVFLNLFSSHFFVPSRGSLIVVKECYETLKSRPVENILFHEGKQRVSGFVSIPVRLGTCRIMLLSSAKLAVVALHGVLLRCATKSHFDHYRSIPSWIHLIAKLWGHIVHADIPVLG